MISGGGETLLHCLCRSETYNPVLDYFKPHLSRYKYQTNTYDQSAAHMCCLVDNSDALSSLIDAKLARMCDINMLTPLELCMESGSTKCALILLPYCLEPGPVFIAAVANYRFFAIDYLYQNCLKELQIVYADPVLKFKLEFFLCWSDY